MFELGDKVKDAVTNYEGVIIGHTKWLHGCDRFSVQAQMLDKEGKPSTTYTFDEGQLILLEKGAYQKIQQAALDAKLATAGTKPGGPRDEPSRREDPKR